MLGTEVGDGHSENYQCQENLHKCVKFCDFLGQVVRTVLEGVRDDDVGLVRFLQDGAMRGTEEHHERLGPFDGWVLDVVHDGQTAGLERDSEESV